MELIIKIPDSVYEKALAIKGTDEELSFEDRLQLEIALENSIPLPKGHGKIVDVLEIVKSYAFEKETNALCGDDDAFIEAIKHVSAIVEEDRTEVRNKE